MKDFVPLVWPIAIVFVVFSFYQPIYRGIDNLSNSLSQVTHLKIGDLELEIDPATLPKPSELVATAIKTLDKDSLLAILDLDAMPANVDEAGGGLCSVVETSERMIGFRKLETSGIVEIIAMDEKNSWCPNPHVVGLTDLGQSVKAFAVDLLATQLTSASED